MKKFVVITGASSGIGEATAKLLSSKGYNLLLLARRLEKLESFKLPNTICKKVDVQDISSFENAIEQAKKEFGEVDCLINNAGVMLLGNVEHSKNSEWQKMIDINVKGLLNGIGLVIDDMKSRQNGTIINISSIAGRKNFPSHTVYCGTKFAVHAISEGLREEVSSNNIRVTTIAPGAVETELLSHTTDNAVKNNYEDWKKEIGGAVSPDDVANAIYYAYKQPQNLCIREIVLATTKQQP